LAVAGAAGVSAAGEGGAAISPDFARALYERLLPLGESDGCRLARFDTQRSWIAVSLKAPSGSEHDMQIATATRGESAARRTGGWRLTVAPGLERECGATLAAIERVLGETATPHEAPWRADRWTSVRANYALLAASFVVLVLWTARILLRQARAAPAPLHGVLALAAVWSAGLALRLFLSPQTFLHEYYHIAETLLGHLRGETGPVYGDTGPALFQLAAAAAGRPHDVGAIFVTNAVLASLAVPAAALLELALTGSWPRALAAAAFLCVLPQHLRFSASEVLFVQAVTFALWALALFALYLRSGRLEDALCTAVALSLAMQTRPEMLFFPAVLGGLVLLVEPRSWRRLLHRRTLLALVVLLILFVPRLLELRQVLSAAAGPPPNPPDARRYLESLVLLQDQVTPPLYRALLIAGTAFGLWRTPGLVVWAALAFLGYSYFSLSLFDNPPYNVRSQLLAASFLVFVAAGAAPGWMALWGRRGRLGAGLGGCLLLGLGAHIVVGAKGFITELRDQQLEWAFLERSVGQLPPAGTLLTAVEVGGRNLAAFPQFLLQRDRKSYRLVDLRRAAAGEAPWPAPGEDSLFYQGMFCYFAFPEEAAPDPMTAPCLMVRRRYAVEPLLVERLDTQGYSALTYAPGPYEIGFFRLRERK
jgi:hypothetical protein